MSKVQFNLKDAHWAKMTGGNVGADGTATYGAFKALKGSVSINLDPQGNIEPFYADGIQYYLSSKNNGYQGDFVIAEVPEEFKKEILAEIADSNNVLVEVANAEPVHFALAFRFDGDTKGRLHVLYNCVAQRSAVAGQTDEDSKTIQTATLNITASTVYNSTLKKNIVKASTDENTPDEIMNAWFNQVYTPAGEISA